MYWICYDLLYNKLEVGDLFGYLYIFLCKNVDLNVGFKCIDRKIIGQMGVLIFNDVMQLQEMIFLLF